MKNLTAILEQGEDHATEFSSRFRNESLAKEVVAFSNSSGGSIFIGIEDDGTVSGVDDKTTEERVITICRNLIEPSVLPEIFYHQYSSGKRVLEVAIPKGLFKYKIKEQNRFCVRVGTVCLEPSMPELIGLLQPVGLYHFEIRSLPGTSCSDLDWLRFPEYCQTRRKVAFEEQDTRQLFKNWQLLDPHEQMTVAGALFFALNPERLLPQSSIQLFRFIGLDSTSNIADQKEVSTYRNPNISPLCHDYGLVEKADRGLQKIVAICRQLGLPQPHFQCESMFVKTPVFKMGSHTE